MTPDLQSLADSPATAPEGYEGKLSDFVDVILLDWLPDSLRDSIDGAIMYGASREQILFLTRQAVGRDSFTYLATWAYLERNHGGPLPESLRADLSARPVLRLN